MTDLHVAQPVFTLLLHSMFRLRATTLLAIVGRGMGHSRLSGRNTLQMKGRIVATKKSGQRNQTMQHDSSPGPSGRRVGLAVDRKWLRWLAVVESVEQASALALLGSESEPTNHTP